MKTVLVDVTSLSTRQRHQGVGRHTLELVAGLRSLSDAERGPIRILAARAAPSFGPPQAVPLEQLDTNAAPVDASRNDDQRVRWTRRFAFWRLAHLVSADLVHLPDPHATPIGLRLLGIPRVVTCHDLSSLRAVGGRHAPSRAAWTGRREIVARRFASADHVIAISTHTADGLRHQCDVIPSRISVVYNGIDSARWSACADVASDDRALTDLGLRAHTYVLYVGAAAWRKNHNGMLRGLRHARDLRPDAGIELAWAGRLSAADSASIDRVARDLGVRHAVHLLGFVPDRALAALYRNAAAHLLVSHYEGFGLTVVEAMACGCPVITTRRTALAEVSGDASVDVDPDDHDAIGEAIVRVKSDQDLRNDLIRRGLTRSAVFTRQRQASETLRVYRQLLGV